jgi:hypothetical protein
VYYNEILNDLLLFKAAAQTQPVPSLATKLQALLAQEPGKAL